MLCMFSVLLDANISGFSIIMKPTNLTFEVDFFDQMSAIYHFHIRQLLQSYTQHHPHSFFTRFLKPHRRAAFEEKLQPKKNICKTDMLSDKHMIPDKHMISVWLRCLI